MRPTDIDSIFPSGIRSHVAGKWVEGEGAFPVELAQWVEGEPSRGLSGRAGERQRERAMTALACHAAPHLGGVVAYRSEGP